jgi:hypothetical protein
MKSKQNHNPKLSRSKIITEAVTLADSDGFEKLSMRRLADNLGVEAMSLYHYYSSKKELINEMVDSLVPTIDSPDCINDWREAMKNRAHAIRKVFIKHPWVAQLFVSGINTGPSMFAYSDASIGYLIRAGFSYKMADYAWNIIDSYIYGFNLQAQNFPFKPSEYQNVAKQYIHMIPKSKYPFVHGMTMQIIEGSHDGIQDFDFGLNLILDALEEVRLKSNSK